MIFQDLAPPDGLAVCFPQATWNRVNLTCVQHGHRGILRHVRYENEYRIAMYVAECVTEDRLRAERTTLRITVVCHPGYYRVC